MGDDKFAPFVMPAFPGVMKFIEPLEFEQLEPRQYTPEEATAIKQGIAAAHERGDFKLPKPVFLLGTLANANSSAPQDLAAIAPGDGYFTVFDGPIPAQPDPSKVVGVVTGGPPPERDYPPIPGPGFYWARIEGADRWEPVEVYEAGHRRTPSASPAEPDHRPGARRSGHRQTPPVPPWARKRGRR